MERRVDRVETGVIHTTLVIRFPKVVLAARKAAEMPVEISDDLPQGVRVDATCVGDRQTGAAKRNDKTSSLPSSSFLFSSIPVPFALLVDLTFVINPMHVFPSHPSNVIH